MALVADRGFRRNLGTGTSLSFVMPMKCASRILVAVLSIASSMCAATDTLDCSGEPYSISVHVGSEGIADFTLFGPEEPLASGNSFDLEIDRFEWHESKDHSRNIILVRTRDGFVAPFMLAVSGEMGTLEVGNVAASVVCDWQK